MKFVDDLNRTPQDAFGGAVIFGSMGVMSLAVRADDGKISVGALVIAALFLIGAVLLFLRGRQMQRTQMQTERRSPVPDSRSDESR